MSETEILSAKILIKLRYSSWATIIDCIRSKDSKIDTKGNFWAAIQEIELQLDEVMGK